MARVGEHGVVSVSTRIRADWAVDLYVSLISPDKQLIGTHCRPPGLVTQ
jgi:hypothetical protein